MQRLIAIQWPQGDAMLKRKKFTQRKKFTPRADRPKEERAKERERMAEALAAYHLCLCPVKWRFPTVETGVGRDGPETAPEISSTDCRDKMRARIPASSGAFATIASFAS